MTSPTKPVNKIRAVWQGDHRFDSGRVGGPAARIDSDAATGQGPMDALLSALATCAAVDVIDIMEKRRTPMTSLEIEVVGERRATAPRRYLTIDLTFHIVGPEVERTHAERAVALSLGRYCSVASSLAPDIVVQTVIVLNGERGEPVCQAISG